MEELLECPFCGEKGYSHKPNCYIQNLINHGNPCEDRPALMTISEYTKAWNTRASGWVSIDDRLPNDGAQVQIFWGQFKGDNQGTSYYNHSRGLWCDDMCVDHIHQPTHWKQLSKAPE